MCPLQGSGLLTPRRGPGGECLGVSVVQMRTQTRRSVRLSRSEKIPGRELGTRRLVWALRCSRDPAPQCPRLGREVSAASSLGAGPCTAAHPSQRHCGPEPLHPASSGTNGPVSAPLRPSPSPPLGLVGPYRRICPALESQGCSREPTGVRGGRRAMESSRSRRKTPGIVLAQTPGPGSFPAVSVPP